MHSTERIMGGDLTIIIYYLAAHICRMAIVHCATATVPVNCQIVGSGHGVIAQPTVNSKIVNSNKIEQLNRHQSLQTASRICRLLLVQAVSTTGRDVVCTLVNGVTWNKSLFSDYGRRHCHLNAVTRSSAAETLRRFRILRTSVAPPTSFPCTAESSLQHVNASRWRQYLIFLS